MDKTTLYTRMAENAFWLAQNTYCGDDSLTVANKKTHYVSGGFPMLLLNGKTFQYVIPNDEGTLEGLQPITILKNMRPIALVQFNMGEYGDITTPFDVTLY
jgi:hypothetical protein